MCQMQVCEHPRRIVWRGDVSVRRSQLWPRLRHLRGERGAAEGQAQDGGDVQDQLPGRQALEELLLRDGCSTKVAVFVSTFGKGK